MAHKSGASRPQPNPRLWPQAAALDSLRFRHTPLLFAALCFALGEALTLLPPHLPRLTLLIAAATITLLALAALALLRAPRLAPLCACALWLAVGLWSAQIQPAPSPQTALLAYSDGLSRTIEARVIRIRELPAQSASQHDADSDPDQWDEPGAPVLSIDLALTAIEQVTPDTSRMLPVSGGLRATLLAPAPPRHGTQNPTRSDITPSLHCGDRIAAPIRLRIPERYRDPGAWQYADFLLDQGIAVTGSLRAAQLRIHPVNPSLEHPLDLARCRIFAAQAWAASRLDTFVHSAANRRLPTPLRLTPTDAGMLNAMLFGDRSRLSQPLRLGFERTGSFHLFVVSGLHVALLAGILLWIAHRLHLGPLASTLLTLVLSTAYALLTGFGVPVQRAL